MKFVNITKIFLHYFLRYKLFLLFIAIYFVFATYFLKGLYTLDPDFGWRIRVGEIIAHQGIPRTDPFSYTMPTFPFVDHSWFFSLLTYLTHPIFGNAFLSLFLTFLVFIALHVANLRLSEEDLEYSDAGALFRKWVHPATLSIIAFLLIFFSVRAQIVSWLFFAIENLLLFKKDNFVRYKYFLPALFLVWANLHGGYFLGLMVLAYFVIFRFFVSKKGTLKEVLILLGCVIVTLITPYGLGGWREVASSVFDSRLRWSIMEWMPSITLFDISMAFYLAVSVTMLFVKGRDIPKIQRFLFWGLLLFAMTSKRNMPFFMLYSLPLTIAAIGKFYSEIRGSDVARERFQSAFVALEIFSLAVLLSQTYFSFWKDFIAGMQGKGSPEFYPVLATQQVRETNIKGEIFSSYGWGGYLLWKLPEKRVFIDGRMPSWKFNPPQNSDETKSAYDDYLKIETGDLDFNSVSDKYNIEYVLWPKERESVYKKIENKIRSIGILGNENDDFSFREYLESNDWKLVYSDGTSLLYKRFINAKI
jgi:hypothetical protein